MVLRVGSQTCFLEFALPVTLCSHHNFPFTSRASRAAQTSSAPFSDDGFCGSRAARWPGLSCNLKGHGIASPVGQRALELDARAQPTLKEHSTLISLVI